MAEPKKKKLTASTAAKTKKEAAPVGNATGLRIGAVALWVVAIALEVVAYLMLIGKINLTFMATLTQVIIALVLDLVCVIVGSALWKKANHIKPASEKNKLLFWLWNNMGLIVSTIAFLPFVILALTNKDADKKTKTIATVVAAVALLIGSAASIDYNPVSEEQQTAAIEAINTDVIYPQEGEVFSHMSEASPDKILKTGLRCRGSSHKNTQWKKFENWYGDRIYLTKITPGFERRLNQLAGEAEQAKEEWYEQENPDPADKPDVKKLYCYEIRLPKTFPLHQDPEYGKNRYYVNQNIPPKFIKYARWIELLA
jgi:hypothetical protein